MHIGPSIIAFWVAAYFGVMAFFETVVFWPLLKIANDEFYSIGAINLRIRIVLGLCVLVLIIGVCFRALSL